jgi:polyphosphate kinase
MVVRGICALRPGVPGLSETIRVRSILGRFLEHSRIFAFAHATGPADAPFEGPEVYIGSADLMHRNLDRRVEALVRISDPDQVSELIELMDESTDDGTSSWHLEPDGTWRRHHLGPDGPLVDLQAALIYRQRRRPGTGR